MAKSRTFLTALGFATLFAACGGDDESGDPGAADAAPTPDAPEAIADGGGPDAADPPDAAPGVDAPPAPPPKITDAVLDGLAPAPLATTAEALLWARTASAPQIAFNAYLPITQADALLSGGQICPKLVVAGDVRTYTGGCSTTGGDAWSGVARVTGPFVDGVPVSVSYVGFGHNAVTTCGGNNFTTVALYTGTIARSAAVAPLPVVFDLRVATSRPSAACVAETFELAYDYALTLTTAPDGNMNGQPDQRTWGGVGRVGKSAGEVAGLVAATTTLEVTGEACGTEALSGTTLLTAGTHTLALAYDGATDCDNNSTVRRTFDGNDLGELIGVSCRVTPGGRTGGVGFAAAALLLLGLLGRRARRTRA